MDEETMRALAAKFLESPKRRSNLIWKLAKEAAEKQIRPLVDAEVAKVIPACAKEIAEAAAKSAAGTNYRNSYSLQQAVERLLIRALGDLEFNVTVRDKPPPPPESPRKKR